MKPFFLICAIYFSSSAHGQLPEDTLNFQLMRFDWQLRGTWGANQCIRDLLNCYEMMKGDIICQYHHWYSSVCSILKEHCDDDHGYRDADSHFEMKESYCRAEDGSDVSRGGHNRYK